MEKEMNGRGGWLYRGNFVDRKGGEIRWDRLAHMIIANCYLLSNRLRASSLPALLALFQTFSHNRIPLHSYESCLPLPFIGVMTSHISNPAGVAESSTPLLPIPTTPTRRSPPTSAPAQLAPTTALWQTMAMTLEDPPPGRLPGSRAPRPVLVSRLLMGGLRGPVMLLPGRSYGTGRSPSRERRCARRGALRSGRRRKWPCG
jgi:hypothetical protein